jgi:hypothetical protein
MTVFRDITFLAAGPASEWCRSAKKLRQTAVETIDVTAVRPDSAGC